MSSSRDDQPMGLRERKKAKTRAAIQQHALRLFLEQGYPETTVEQIAEAAEVSPSTFFRYFPTKEETVLYDPLDPVFIAAFVRQPAELSALAALRAALHEVTAALAGPELDRELERQRLVFLVPELRSALLEKVTDGMSMLIDATAERIGRDSNDLDVRTWAGAVLGAVLASYTLALEERRHGFIDYIDASLARLENGLPL